MNTNNHQNRSENQSGLVNNVNGKKVINMDRLRKIQKNSKKKKGKKKPVDEKYMKLIKKSAKCSIQAKSKSREPRADAMWKIQKSGWFR
jgi:hypothetical protein